MAIEIRSVTSFQAALGEGAFWDDRDQLLWWVDIDRGQIHRYDPRSSENRTYTWGEPVGCLAVRDRGGLVLAAKSGFWFFDPMSGAREAISNPETHLPHNRFNDGTTDTSGSFWAGSMKDGGPAEPSGSIYRLDPDLTVSCWKEGLYTANGLAFSPGGKRMYFSDSNPSVRTIWVCDYDIGTGSPGKPEVFFDTRSVPGRPDGGTVDSEGCYWQAGVSGWQIYRLSPDGEVLLTLDMPVEKPTKAVFGGAKLETLYVTSASVGLAEGRHQPEAGRLFEVTGLGVVGIPQTRFAG